MQVSKISKVTLLGAGPGDPDLITLAGVKALQSAAVVLYDALAHPQLLEWAPQAEKIFVGKRKGYKRFTQAEINQMLIKYALEKGHTVRLKGGDPFVFGRGSEELDKLHASGIQTAFIPGISSATSVPATQGIAVTKRGIAESFWVLTGMTKDRKLSEDIKLAAQSTATLVVLMGMTHLPKIVAHFQEIGKGNLPIAIIQNGYMPDEQSAIGTIDTILPMVAAKQLSNPAIIVIGETVKARSVAQSFAVQHHLVKQNRA